MLKSVLQGALIGGLIGAIFGLPEILTLLGY